MTGNGKKESDMAKQLTLRENEITVLASLIADKTAKAAKAAVRRAKLDPLKMFTDTEVRETFSVFLQFGAEVLGGYVCGVKIHDFATPYIETNAARIVREYERRMRETDRPLTAFERPGPDTDDADCLFQNRWLRRGACGALISTSGVGKSSFSLQAATLWAGGCECLGIKPIKPLKIGIFQSEDDDFDVGNFRYRIGIGIRSELEWTEEQITEAENRVIMCGLDGSTGAEFCEHIRRKLEKYHFDLIIINPFLAFFGGDPNKGVDVTEFFRQHLMGVIGADATKCGCLIIHHTGKPNQEAMKQGDIFKAYIGVGSSEFTNCIRSALAITPWKGGKVRGVFELVGAKHGDRLAWRDGDGNTTINKIICYANVLPEHKTDGALFWIEPDAAQLEEIKKQANQTESRAGKPEPIAKCAETLAGIIRNVWGTNKRPDDLRKKDNQREWVIRQKKKVTGFSRSTHEAAWNLIQADPLRFGLKLYGGDDGRGKYFIAAETPDENPPLDEIINPEQEDLF